MMKDEQNTLAFGIAVVRDNWERINKVGTEYEIFKAEEEFADLIATMISNGHGLGFAEARKVAEELYQEYFKDVIGYDSYAIIFPFVKKSFDAYDFVYDNRFDFIFTDTVKDVHYKTKAFIFERLQGHFEYMRDSQLRKVEKLQEEIKFFRREVALYDDQIERMQEFSRITEVLKNS